MQSLKRFRKELIMPSFGPPWLWTNIEEQVAKLGNLCSPAQWSVDWRQYFMYICSLHSFLSHIKGRYICKVQSFSTEISKILRYTSTLVYFDNALRTCRLLRLTYVRWQRSTGESIYRLVEFMLKFLAPGLGEPRILKNWDRKTKEINDQGFI